jgi:cell division protein FtsB
MRVIALFLLVAVLALHYQYWLGDSGQLQVKKLKTQIAQQQLLNQNLKKRNQRLSAEVQDLKQGLAAIEEHARSDLGMIKPEEAFFQLTEKP